MKSYRIGFLCLLTVLHLSTVWCEPAAAAIPGDVDGSGDIEVVDVVLALQAASGRDVDLGYQSDQTPAGTQQAVYGMQVLSGLVLPQLEVTRLGDTFPDPEGLTLREALAEAQTGQKIIFNQSFDGTTIVLTRVGAPNTLLKGEVMGMRQTETGPVSYLEGYFRRDYGPSALFAQKDVIIDASMLPNGITIEYDNSENGDARVLAVYGDLVLENVTITGGVSQYQSRTGNIDGYPQPFTLGRGGGIAVWGKAVLDRVRIYDNHCFGDYGQSRDRGGFWRRNLCQCS